MKWKIEHDRQVLIETFERREGWTSCKDSLDSDWNFYWASTSTVQAMFHPEKGKRLSHNQVVNHFPNYYELTRKDSMVKHVKRYLRDNNKRSSSNTNNYNDSSTNMGANITSTSKQPLSIENFLPTSYALPSEYNIFVEEFRRSPSNTIWIMKPCNGAQGKGIFIIDKLDQIKKWNANANTTTEQQPRYVISRYIHNPLLIGGKKFDLRIYVLITSFVPLKIYLGDGFARFANSDYSNDASERQNKFIHFTNVSIQKKSQEYNSAHGGKWNINYLRLYLEAIRGRDATQKLLEDIDDVIVHSAKSVQNVMNNDRHCFECYGYDLLIDTNLKPWLIEINSSPSLTATTSSDKRMKMNLIRDVVNIVMAEKFSPRNHHTIHKTASNLSHDKTISGHHGNNSKHHKSNTKSDTKSATENIVNDDDVDLGDFVLLYDEAAIIQKRNEIEENRKNRR